MNKTYDIIIVGGGHAGLEAAWSASMFKNLKIALITMPGVGIGSAPCNPSIGGVGKGQVVREIAAFGGIMPELADMAGIQYRTLNESKGYAVQSTRVQIDKDLYPKFAQEKLETVKNLDVVFEKVSNIIKNDEFNIITEKSEYRSKKLIVTVGTFLNGKLHIGSEQTLGGRLDCESSASLSGLFSNIKTLTERFKTGTPPRLTSNTIDYSVLEEQKSDYSVKNFSFQNKPFNRNIDQVSCYLARTNIDTMTVIRENLDKSPMYNGQIDAIGARYCPSVEDKASRYPDKNVHHVFVEPEGLKATTVYPSGISSSLPKDIQDKIVSSIPGLEKANIEKYGYAVEYDVIDTTLLDHTLEHQDHSGLYFAGQVNGTSGYEEAAGQGLIAGYNASLNLLGFEKLILNRNNSYIGVMVEDLISNKRDEPYRLFTARSENRLYIREDNAIERIAKYRKVARLNDYIDIFNDNFTKNTQILMNVLRGTFIGPNDLFIKNADIKLKRRISLSEMLKLANLDPITVLKSYLEFIGIKFNEHIISTVAITNKYEGYISKSDDHYAKMAKLDSLNLDWKELIQSENISFECKRRIEKIRPTSFGQLKIIEGIRPATLAAVAGRSF